MHKNLKCSPRIQTYPAHYLFFILQLGLNNGNWKPIAPSARKKKSKLTTSTFNFLVGPANPNLKNFWQEMPLRKSETGCIFPLYKAKLVGHKLIKSDA